MKTIIFGNYCSLRSQCCLMSQLNELMKLSEYRRCSGGAMVLGKLQVPRRPTIWITVGQGPTALAAGEGCFDIFTLIYPFSPLSPSLWETVRYRLKHCLKGPLNPKQPSNRVSIKCQSHSLTLVKDHSDFKVKTCFSQKQSGDLEPKFI